MATKKLIIEAEVKTDQLDKAVQKLGQLKDLGKGLKIQYDIDGKPLEVVIDKTLNLQQQVKVLTSELRKTKEGTAEFTLLSSKLNNTKDDLTRVNAKSRELFATFSLIPGPIGEIFGKLNGVIGLLKTFSGFSIKDIGNQFKGFGRDIIGIIDGFYGVNKAVEETTTTFVKQSKVISSNNDNTQQNTTDVQDNTDAQDDNTNAIDQGNAATNASNAALIKNQTERKASTERIVSEAEAMTMLRRRGIDTIGTVVDLNGKEGDLGQTLEDNTGKIKEYSKEQINLIRQFNNEEVAIVENSRSLEGLDIALAKAGERTKSLTLQQKLLALGLKVVEFGARAAELALKSIGIGLVIAAVAFLVDGLITFVKKLYDVATGAGAAEAATRSLTTAIEEQQRVLQNDLDAIDMANRANITRAKIAGKSEEEITRITKEGNANRLAELIKNDELLVAQRKKINDNEKLSVEDRQKLNKDINDKILKSGQDITKQILTNEQFRLDNTLSILEKKKKGVVKSNKDITNDNDKANELLLKLQQENSVNILNEERKKQDAQLKIDKQNEEREVNNLKLSKDKEELRAKLLEQIRVKYGVKVIELNKKRQEEDSKTFDEDQKKIKEYNDKVFEIMNAADESEIGRNKATLERKYADDVAALQKDTNFQKQSLEEKIRIILLLEKAKNQAIQKLDDDDAQNKRDKNLKRLDDELKFLQIRGEALREGTKSFFDNQRALLKAAEKKELADLEDRGIKEKLTIEQIEAEKLNIKKKYLKASKDIATQELQAILQAAQATLGVAQTIAQDIGKVAQIEQQVALEQATKRYIKQNELDKKTITNQEQLDAKLIENKKKFAQEEDDIKRKAFEENKKIQIAQAIIATLQSAVGAFSSLIAIPIVGPVLAPIAAAAALVFGYKQVAAIKKTQYQSSLELSSSETSGVGSVSSKCNPGKNYADGGLIGGKRHAQGGTMIEAEQGEAIMTRGAVTQFAPLLSLMNQAGGGTSFNSNLMTTRQDNPILSNPAQEQAPLIVKTYVVSQELTTEAHKQARLKNLSTI